MNADEYLKSAQFQREHIRPVQMAKFAWTIVLFVVLGLIILL